MELLVILLRSQAEELYLSKECKEDVIQKSVKSVLEENLKKNKISSTEYQKALDILKTYKEENQ